MAQRSVDKEHHVFSNNSSSLESTCDEEGKSAQKGHKIWTHCAHIPFTLDAAAIHTHLKRTAPWMRKTPKKTVIIMANNTKAMYSHKWNVTIPTSTRYINTEAIVYPCLDINLASVPAITEQHCSILLGHNKATIIDKKTTPQTPIATVKRRYPYYMRDSTNQKNVRQKRTEPPALAIIDLRYPLRETLAKMQPIIQICYTSPRPLTLIHPLDTSPYQAADTKKIPNRA